MNCQKNRVFLVENLFNELKTEGEKRIARLNLGVPDSESFTWDNIHGNIYDSIDLINLIETVKGTSPDSGIIFAFRLNDATIDRTYDGIPLEWSLKIPEITDLDTDILYMTQATKELGLYQRDENDNIWSVPVKINYTNNIDIAQDLGITNLGQALEDLLNTINALVVRVNGTNYVTVEGDKLIITDAEGNETEWEHQSLEDYIKTNTVYQNSESITSDNYTSFLLTDEGKLTANGANISGKFYGGGTFSGKLDDATGSFTGKVTATSGNIGGWEIHNGVILPTNIPASAITGTLTAELVNFGSTLTNLRVALISDYTNKINTLKNQSLAKIDELHSLIDGDIANTNNRVNNIVTIANGLHEKIHALNNELALEASKRIAGHDELNNKINLKFNNALNGINSVVDNKFSAIAENIVTKAELDTRLTLVEGEISNKVSLTAFNLNNLIVAQRLAELAITEGQVRSIVQYEINRYSPSGYVTTTQYLSAITQLQDKINSKVSSTVYNSNKEVVSNRISELELTTSSINAKVSSEAGLLASLGLSADGIIMAGKRLAYYKASDLLTPVFECNADGSGRIARGGVSWDSEGNVTLANNIRIAWENITDKPTFPEEFTVDNVLNIILLHYKGTSKPNKPTKTTVIKDTDVINQWTTVLPSIQNGYKFYICYKIVNGTGTFSFTDVQEDKTSEIALNARKQLDELFTTNSSTLITSNYIYTGSFGAQLAYIMHLKSDTSDNPKWELKVDGSGHLSGGNLSWDTNGNLTMNGSITAIEGSIGGWGISEHFLLATHEDFFIKLYDEAMIEMGKVNESTSLRITPSSLLIASPEDGIDYPHTCFNSDGSGFLANNNLTWDTFGNLTINGTIRTSNGNIAGWDINADSLSSEVSNRNPDATDSSITYTTHNLEFNKGAVTEEMLISPSIHIQTMYQRGATPIAGYTAVDLDAYGLSIIAGNRHHPNNNTTINYIGVLNGFLANSNISWDENNNVTVKFTLSNNGVDYDITLDNEGIHYVNTEDDSRRGTLTWVALIDNVS